MMRKAWALGLAGLMLVCGAAWAIKLGDPAPSLTIKPVNRDGDAYDIVKTSKGECGLVFATLNGLTDANAAKLVACIEAVHRAVDKPDKPSNAVLVMVAPHEHDAAVAEFVKKAGLTMPVAVVPAGELDEWGLPEDMKALFVSVGSGKVEKICADGDALEKELKQAGG